MRFGLRRKATQQRPDTSPRDRLKDLAERLTEQAKEELAAEGGHPPMYLLWSRRLSQPLTVLLDDTSRATVARWSAQIAAAAAENRATVAVLIMEGLGAPPPGLAAEARESLIVAAADALGGEVLITTPLASQSDGKRHVNGASEVSTNAFSGFADVQELWLQWRSDGRIRT